ncbi:hypothetical protein E6C76_21930 [Pseudothauera nasutitermitis]|uniref:Bacterial Ig-like domain-containing protein n=1 Tax=Pseudothauera nasutitermitis TaxID=2565930 RepID=A0A4S4AMN8_9RHOO|nr:hypothetical protein [Pseudothauera nasutitermitis]THF60423.1 hypothetical protein E6C76_21930 [Pseudothauera nasutitermitis]
MSFEISDAGVGTLTGTSEHATSVSVTITGSDGSNLGPFPATLNPDGSWSVDLSGESFDEEVTYTATATATADGSWSVDLSGESFDEEVTYTATATATDNASNTATDTDTAGYDLLPTVGVSFEISDAGVGTLTGTSEHATSVSVSISGSDGSSYGPEFSGLPHNLASSLLVQQFFKKLNNR